MCQGRALVLHRIAVRQAQVPLFIQPARHYLSGYNYDPKTNHLAIDLAANLGDPIYAADGGLIVYAG